jgi:hypothetical protein
MDRSLPTGLCLLQPSSMLSFQFHPMRTNDTKSEECESSVVADSDNLISALAFGPETTCRIEPKIKTVWHLG